MNGPSRSIIRFRQKHRLHCHYVQTGIDGDCNCDLGTGQGMQKRLRQPLTSDDGEPCCMCALIVPASSGQPGEASAVVYCRRCELKHGGH